MEENKQATRLFAKLKGARGEHKVIFSSEKDMNDVAFFDAPDISPDRVIEYAPERKLESDEWFYLDLDGEHLESIVNPYLKNNESSADINTVISEDYSKIEVIYKVEDKSIVFSRVLPSQRIENIKLLNLFGEHPTFIKHKGSIEMTGRVDAYYNGSSRLYFKAYGTIRPFMPSIEYYYKEATREDKEKFLANDLFEVGSDFDVDKIGVRQAKRIAAILDDNIDLSNNDIQQKIKDYASEYPEAKIEINGVKKIVINDSKQLDSVLILLSGRYYTSEITGEKMMAHDTSKLVMGRDDKKVI